jgi:hypothetical protein
VAPVPVIDDTAYLHIWQGKGYQRKKFVDLPGEDIFTFQGFLLKVAVGGRSKYNGFYVIDVFKITIAVKWNADIASFHPFFFQDLQANPALCDKVIFLVKGSYCMVKQYYSIGTFIEGTFFQLHFVVPYLPKLNEFVLGRCAVKQAKSGKKGQDWFFGQERS